MSAVIRLASSCLVCTIQPTAGRKSLGIPRARERERQKERGGRCVQVGGREAPTSAKGHRIKVSAKTRWSCVLRKQFLLVGAGGVVSVNSRIAAAAAAAGGKDATAG